jgi:hypothetical protein
VKLSIACNDLCQVAAGSDARANRRGIRGHLPGLPTVAGAVAGDRLVQGPQRSKSLSTCYAAPPTKGLLFKSTFQQPGFETCKSLRGPRLAVTLSTNSDLHRQSVNSKKH